MKDNVYLCLITYLYVSFFLPMGSVVATLLLLGCFLFDRRGRVNRHYPGYLVYILTFVVFCFLSCTWAAEPSYGLTQAQHLAKTLFGIAVLYFVVDKKMDVDTLLKAALWGGYVILAYAILFYGVRDIQRMFAASERLNNDLMNANQFAMCIAYSCVIHVYYGLKGKWNLSHLLIIPAVLMLAISGSRKGLVILVAGVLSLYIYETWRAKKSLKTIMKVLLVVAALAAGFIAMINLPPFSMLKERIMNVFSLLGGSSDVDNSLLTRMQYIRVGIDLFFKHPLIGVGLDNARIYNLRNVYLHNNFVEMLADGGIIGFGIYYSMYVWLLVMFARYRKYYDEYSGICLILLVMAIAIQYAHVAYKTSGEYYMLLLFYEEARRIRKKRRKPIRKENLEVIARCRR